MVRVVERAVQRAGNGNDAALALAKYTLAVALFHRDAEADRDRALDLMLEFRDFTSERGPFLVPLAELWIAREQRRGGDRDAAIAAMREAVDEMLEIGQIFYGVWGLGVLVETLLAGDVGDELAEAQKLIDRLADLAAQQDSAMLDITLLRLRALMAQARRDYVAFRRLADRYRAMAESLGFEGHIAWAEAMVASGD